ncbi:unnamed protein product [Acanthoscelides obtectus]|uniref:Transposase n=1 Tax=Acanthoscelides obtectus TaxID=200917 RepID=A0A9P0KHH3_ACAOB|nr:unnamed protein product [Acanthoscelides obtectus]CAK1667657.1 hypothetical protein AOBTE_LOCUS25972 [Acanthoscelides obtectus]
MWKGGSDFSLSSHWVPWDYRGYMGKGERRTDSGEEHVCMLHAHILTPPTRSAGWIKDNAAKDFPRKENDLKNSLQRFLTVNPRPHKFNDNRPGDRWVKGFLKRHPDISKRTAEGVILRPVHVPQNRTSETDHSRILNADELGFEICPSTGKVFAAKGTRNVYSVECGSSKENITVLFTFSADSTTCVPMVVFPYQRIPEKITKGINPKWGIGRSDKG